MNRTAVAAIAIAIVVAAVGGFAILSSNNYQPRQIQIANYSAQINSTNYSTNPQVSIISKNLTSGNNSSYLGSVQNDLANIKGKLSDLEAKVNQSNDLVQQNIPNNISSVSSEREIIVTLDNDAVFPGQTIYLTATGIAPETGVQILLRNAKEVVLVEKEGITDSTGKLTSSMEIPRYLIGGTYDIRVVSGPTSGTQPIIVYG